MWAAISVKSEYQGCKGQYLHSEESSDDNLPGLGASFEMVIVSVIRLVTLEVGLRPSGDLPITSVERYNKRYMADEGAM